MFQKEPNNLTQYNKKLPQLEKITEIEKWMVTGALICFIKKEKEAEIVSILEFLEDNPKELDDITVGLPEKMNLLGRK